MSLGRLNETAMKLRQENQALSLRQLGAAYGFGYVRIKQMQALPGFPLLAGKVIPSDFDQWRMIRTTDLNSQHRANRPHSAVGKAHALKSTSDSPTSWRQIGCNLRAAIESHESREGNGSNDV